MIKPDCIMLIDDDPITNFLHEKLLKKFNYCKSIQCFLNGAPALEYLQRELDLHHESPEMIFVDMFMPVMDGFEFLEKYQTMNFSNREEVTIIGLTNSTNPKDIEHLKTLNCRYINKPLTEEALQFIFN